MKKQSPPFEVQVLNTILKWKEKGWSNFQVQSKDLKAIVVFEKGKKKKYFGGQVKDEEELKKVVDIFNNIIKENEQQTILQENPKEV